MRITVIGAGNSGLAMSAHLSANGHSVALWNRSEKAIEKLITTNTIITNGIINAHVLVDTVTTDIMEALDQTELILITTPANSIEYLGELLAKVMSDDIPIILNPGRTFGSLVFYKSFSANNNLFQPKIAETQTIVYTCRKNASDNVTIYSLKKEVEIAALRKEDLGIIIKTIPDCLRNYFKITDSFLNTSFGNVGSVLHCVPFMLNAGWTECQTAEYKYYYDGITPTIGRFIQHIDDERIAVGKSLGIVLESTMDWMKREYETHGSTLFECIQNNPIYRKIYAPKSLYHRYIFEDVPTGLVPIEKMGKELGLETRYTSLAIDLANALFDEDFRVNMQWIDYKAIKEFL